MPKVLLTAFEPYDRWKTNASWLALVQLTHNMPAQPAITTRLYPVDFSAVCQRLTKDLADNYDFAIHVGQSPGSGRIQLESIGLNIGGASNQPAEQYESLVQDGPVAYQSDLPLVTWARKLQETGIPAQVSYHAGTYLCNATLYLSHYLSQQQARRTRSAFIHVPLDVSQVVGCRENLASMPSAMTASALRIVLEAIAQM